ncbi:MAG: hypothetical protein WED05_07615 [Candidatus Atabeyarchaeum deiterrae]
MSKGAKPVIGFILSLIGGIIILAAGALYALITYPALAILLAYAPALLALLGPYLIGGYIALVWGILILLLSIFMYTKKNKMFGIIILVFGLLNLVGTFIGFIGADFYWVGSILSILGGLLGYMGK